MPQARSYALWKNAEGPNKERDCFTCCHCNKVVFMEPKGSTTKTDLGGFCRQCMKNVCGPCADLGRCTPFERKLEQQEARARMLVSILGG